MRASPALADGGRERLTVLSGVAEPRRTPVLTVGGRVPCVFAALEIAVASVGGATRRRFEFGDKSFFLRLDNGHRVLVDMSHTSRFRWVPQLAEMHLPLNESLPRKVFSEYGLKVGQRITVEGVVSDTFDGPAFKSNRPIGLWFGDRQQALVQMKNEHLHAALWTVSVPFAISLIVPPVVAAFSTGTGLLVLMAALIATPFLWMYVKRQRRLGRRTRWTDLTDLET